MYEYAKLLRDTLAYLKEQKTPCFASKEEALLLQIEKTATRPFHAREPIIKPPSRPKPAAITTALQKKESTPPPAEKQQIKQVPPPSKIRSILQQIAPSLLLKEAPPEDREATQRAHAYKEGGMILLLACDTDEETLTLLKNLSKSLRQQLAPVKIIAAEKIESEKRWELFLTESHARLLIASHGLTRFAEAKSFYTQDASNHCFLKKTPLILLETPPFYANNPKEKILLWKRLCRFLNLRPSPASSSIKR